MSDAVSQALDKVYACLHDNNTGIDAAIAELKTALAAKGEKVAIVDKSKIAQNDRVGRRMMQSYFKKRGVAVEFAETDAKGAA